MTTPKQRVQAIHPAARCVLIADYRWRVFDGERALGDNASTPNFAWQHAAMKVAPPEKRAWIAQPVTAPAPHDRQRLKARLSKWFESTPHDMGKEHWDSLLVAAGVSASGEGRSLGSSVPEGFRLVAVNEGFTPLMDALERAHRKGYMPDTITSDYEGFDYRDPIPAGAEVGKEEAP